MTDAPKKPDAPQSQPPQMPQLPQRPNMPPPVQPKLAQHELEFVDDTRKAMVTESPFWSNALLYGIAIFMLVMLVWSKYAILDEITSAIGKVVPSGEIQIIQSLEGGIVSDLYVKEGDTVQKGQMLLRLDDTQFKSSYYEGLAKYQALVASAARLKAEASGQDHITFPADLIKARPDLVQSETQLFNQETAQLNANLVTLRRSYGLAQQMLGISQPLVQQGLMSKLELLGRESSVNDLQGKINQTLQDFQSKARESYNQNMAQLTSLNEALTGMKDRMVRTTIRSPVKGTVKNINVTTIGGVIQPGMDIMEIVPLEDTLLIEAYVRPADIAFVHPDQEAMVKFTAYDFSIYGGLDGRVVFISPDTMVNPDTPNDKTNYYKILVRTHKAELGTAKKPLPIIPGMTVAVDIKTGRKSVLDYLLNPIMKARTNALRER
jgi:adhesin transport system membrane fusion protein